jgi:hypothetical protein
MSPTNIMSGVASGCSFTGIVALFIVSDFYGHLASYLFDLIAAAIVVLSILFGAIAAVKLGDHSK